MARPPLPDRDKRQKLFLRALISGHPVAQARDAAGIKWSTLYAWRRDNERFRAAWDDAARLGLEAMTARFDAALIQRAIDGVDEPVFHSGEQVGTRRRYSDALLMFGIQDMRERRRSERQGPPRPAARPDENGPITVVIRQFGPPPQLTGSGTSAAALPAPTKEKAAGAVE